MTERGSAFVEGSRGVIRENGKGGKGEAHETRCQAVALSSLPEPAEAPHLPAEAGTPTAFRMPLEREAVLPVPRKACNLRENGDTEM